LKDLVTRPINENWVFTVENAKQYKIKAELQFGLDLLMFYVLFESVDMCLVLEEEPSSRSGCQSDLEMAIFFFQV